MGKISLDAILVTADPGISCLCS